MLNASPIKKITDRQQVLNDLLVSKQRDRNNLKLDGENEEHGARLLRRRTIQIEGRKQSSESNAAPDSANASPQQQASQNTVGSDVGPNSKLNAQPKTEFAPLQPEEGGPSAIKSASEDDQNDSQTEGEKKDSAEQKTSPENEQGTKPPPANEQTAEQLQQEKGSTVQKQAATNHSPQTPNGKTPSTENDQITELQKEIAKLQKQRADIIAKANKDLKQKIRKEWIKLIVSGITLVMIFYYLAKIKIIKMVYSREPREAKNIQKEIEAKNKEIKKIKRTSLRNRLFSRSNGASA